MPRFAYTARDAAGQSVADELDAPTRKDALRRLTARGLQPLRLDEQAAAPRRAKRKANTRSTPTAATSTSTATDRATGRKIRFTRAHLLPFLQALHDLTSSGLSAGEAVRLLASRLKEPTLCGLSNELWNRLSEGANLSRSMADFPAVFDESTLNLLQAGEATGSLNDTLDRLIEHLAEQKELKRQFVAALAYPIFMTIVAGGVILFFLFVLLPRLMVLLNSLGGDLPASTQLLVSVSNFLLAYGLFGIGGAVFLAISFWRWRATAIGRVTSDSWLLKLPLVGAFATHQTVLSISQTLSVLLENGITTAEALRMTERQVGNRVHRAAFDEAIDRVLEGESLTVSLTQMNCFPPLVLDQLAVGENTGNVVPALKKIAINFRRRISNQLQTFTKVIASGVLLSVFVFVGFIAFAMVSAIFSLSSKFNM